MRIDETTLLALAPARLANLRQTRYGGDDMGIRMRDLSPEDDARIRLLYSGLSKLLGDLRVALRIPAGDGGAPGGFSNGSVDVDAAAVDDVAPAREVLRRTAADPAWRSAMQAARGLQYPSSDGNTDADVLVRQRQALHDVRGGALAALALTLDFIAITDSSTADVVRAFYLTRDHLKIMRNALVDVDSDARDRDRTYRDHGSQLLVEKWSAATHRLPNARSARIEVDATYDGPVSRRCLEFSALDRVVYNLMNNAVRFATDDKVTLHLRAVGENLRFVVVNEVATEQLRALRKSQGEDLGGLFRGGFSTGGDGVGLSICGEFVANAYGLASASDAVEGRHVGATLVERTFVAWVHWPMGR